MTSDNEKTSTPRERNLSAEELAKIKADTAKIQQETVLAKEKAALEAKKTNVEIDKLRVELDISLQNFEAGRINVAQITRQEQAALASDLFHQLYFFGDDVNERSVRACIERLTYWDRVAKKADGTPCDIEIIFSSPGGSVFDGFVLFDFIQELKRRGHFITTGSLGMAASMAGILLQAGEVRYVGKEAWVLVHEISSLAYGKSSAIEDEVAFIKRMQDRVINIFLAGNKKGLDTGTATKKLNKTQFIQGWKRKDWWLDSNEALALGFVDQIR